MLILKRILVLVLASTRTDTSTCIPLVGVDTDKSMLMQVPVHVPMPLQVHLLLVIILRHQIKMMKVMFFSEQKSRAWGGDGTRTCTQTRATTWSFGAQTTL